MAITSSYIKGATFDDFDPNHLSKEGELWALYDGQRFRTFAARANVLGAMQHAGKAKLYWMQADGLWREVAVKDGYRKDKRCDWCDDDVSGWGQRWCWRKSGGKIPGPGPDLLELLYLCSVCRDING
jgi:hypothetical protein